MESIQFTPRRQVNEHDIGLPAPLLTVVNLDLRAAGGMPIYSEPWWTIRHGQNELGTVVGRKAWLFYGSDDHAESAAALFSIIASCRLHAIAPEQYLEDVLRLLPYWPAERYLELAPKYWAVTRAKLTPQELESPVGAFTIPS